MDENYLDNLLNEISLDKEIDHKIEDELDSQINEEKLKHLEENMVSKEEQFDLDLEKESTLVTEPMDFNFTEEQMEELDALDNLADLDMGDMDFSDIDFNDLDVTKLEGLDDADFDDLLKDFEGDLEVDDFFNSGEKQREDETSPEVSDDMEGYTGGDVSTVEEMPLGESAENLNEDSFDADGFLDSLLEETDNEKASAEPVETIPDSEPEETGGAVAEETTASDTGGTDEENVDSLEDLMGMLDAEEGEENSPVSEESGTEQAGSEPMQELSQEEVDDLDDLLSMLDMDSPGGDGGDSASSAQQGDGAAEPLSDSDVDFLDELSGIEELEEKPVKKKRTLMQILFGDPDEDDELSSEEMEAIEAKKAEKKAKKAAAKAAKKEKADADKQKKELENNQKKKANDEKNKLKAEKKSRKKAAAAAEAANAEPEKKLNKPMVIFVFSVFLGGLFLFYVSTNNFNYTQAIEKAANYFASQKYRRAFNEIVGVDVKEKDEDLKDRIYTVMYVERLYESYNTNVAMGHEEKALDSLLRGVEKYYEHYEEAEELGITDDLNYSFNQIQQTLAERYGISVEQAQEINSLDNLEYVQRIKTYVENLETSEAN
jgi:hypothetical protein